MVGATDVREIMLVATVYDLFCHSEPNQFVAGGWEEVLHVQHRERNTLRKQ
jgi:hypothetical protein